MSRRVQFHLIHCSSIPIVGSTYKQPAIVVYAPAGRAELEHDPEDLLLAFADILTGGNATSRHGYAINGKPARSYFDRPNPMDLLHGWSGEGRQPERDTRTGSEIIFDAAEVVDRADVWWRVSTARTRSGSIPWQVKEGGLYTRAEILRVAASCLFN